MIADLKFEGVNYRFKVALCNNPKRFGTIYQWKWDYELTCISESFPDKLACKRFDHFDFKKYWRDGIIKVEI